MNVRSDKSKYLFLATIVALVLGALAGMWLGAAAEPLGTISSLVIQLLKAVAVPLLFVAIVDALAKSHLSVRGFRILAGVAAFNATLAVTIALLLVNWLEPGQYLAFIRDLSASALGSAPALTTPGWEKTLQSFVPDSSVGPFVSGATLQVIVLALAIGLALRLVTRDQSSEAYAGAKTLMELTSAAFRILVTVIGWVVYLVPLAVFSAVAKAVGKSGLDVAGGLGVFMVVCLAGMVLHVLVTYQGWVLVHPRVTLRQFWSAAREPTSYAFGINSSLATMPMTLAALGKLPIKEEATRLSACVGTNFNNDGILLYEVTAALILAQAFGLELSLGEQLGVALVSVAATIGVAGFPEAGVVALTLVLGTLGLPSEAIVMLLSVDWLIARSRSATNVLGDMGVAVAIDRFLGSGGQAASDVHECAVSSLRPRIDRP